MKAAVLAENGIEIRDVAKPVLKPTEVLVGVRAASLNRADLLIASGQAHGFAGGPGMIMGGECAGEVEAIGRDVTDLKVGDRVAGSAPGSFSEYVAMDCGRAYRLSAQASHTRRRPAFLMQFRQCMMRLSTLAAYRSVKLYSSKALARALDCLECRSQNSRALRRC